MADPIIEALQAVDHKRVYALSQSSPMSLRDQIFRAALLVRALRNENTIGPSSSLLVVGAGVAGAAAAIAAVRAGVPTTLVERLDQPFMVQYRAPHRLVNPTIYDWPLEHWEESAFPWTGATVNIPLKILTDPLTGKVLTAQAHAFAWRMILQTFAIKNQSLLTVEYSKTAEDVSSTARGVGVWFSKGTPQHFGAVIWAAGIGAEDCQIGDTPIPDYMGAPFWGQIDYLRPKLPKNPRILISGSGDGALQDYLHAVTGERSADELLRKCIPAPKLRDDLRQSLQSVEHRVQLGLGWTSEKSLEDNFLGEVQRRHQTKVNELIRDPGVSDALRCIIPAKPEILLVYRRPWFSATYALNRFLTLLIATFIRQEFSINTLRPDDEIKSIAAVRTGHTCVVSRPDLKYPGQQIWHPSGCYDDRNNLVRHDCCGEDHQVEFKKPPPDNPVFNVIIIRHGIRRSDNDLTVRHPKRPLVYHVP